MQSEAHANKYRTMAKEKHIVIINLGLFNLRDLNDLRGRYEEDHNLNNIPMRYFDVLTVSFNIYHPKERMTLSEGCCLYKQLLIDMVS